MVPWWPVPKARPASISMASSPLSALPAVMRAVDEETAGAHRLQPFQRARHPVDVGQGFALDRLRYGKAGKDVLDPCLDRLDVAVGIERHFVDVLVLVDLQHGDRQAFILEGCFERRENALGLELSGNEMQPRLGHELRQPAASRFNLAIAVSALSP